MSRLIKTALPIPNEVDVKVKSGSVEANGKRGSLRMLLHSSINVESKDDGLWITSSNNNQGRSSTINPMLGTTYRLLNNLFIGVTTGFSKSLIINGVGYRAQVSGNVLKLSLGYSHPVEYSIPEGISIECKTPTEVNVSGNDKQLVGQVAADIREYRKTEPYQGKGIKYVDEYVYRKETKKKK